MKKNNTYQWETPKVIDKAREMSGPNKTTNAENNEEMNEACQRYSYWRNYFEKEP